MKKELQIFADFLKSRNLRHTFQRDKVLGVFLSTEKHVSIDELYALVKKEEPGIGYTTVYRTMKLLRDVGLCTEMDPGDGVLRFEHKYGHHHHDHLICTKCGRFIEVVKPEIEKLQDSLAKKHGFTPTKHKLEIFGVCNRCSGGGREA